MQLHVLHVHKYVYEYRKYSSGVRSGITMAAENFSVSFLAVLPSPAVSVVAYFATFNVYG